MPQATGTNCVKIDIENCFEFDNKLKDGNFQCVKCNYSFYKNSNGRCTAVPKIIDFCGFYDSAETCSECLQGYVLTKDKKRCLKTMDLIQYTDPNCQVPFERHEPVCNMCKPGYTFESDTSTKCVKCSDAIDAGCFICDLNETSRCLLCVSGYHMDAEGKC